MKAREFLQSHPGLNSALGILFAVLAGLLLLGYISKAISSDDAGPMITVPVAAKDITMGAVIEKSDIAVKKIPEEYVVPGSLHSTEEIIKSRSLRFIGKGEPFLDSSIVGVNGSNTLASKIPSDLRAYTLPVGRGSGSTSDLRPGDRVDVLSTSGDPARTATILNGRYVLSVGNGSTSAGEESESLDIDQITLLVTPEEVELLAQAEYCGEISISLCPLKSSDQ